MKGLLAISWMFLAALTGARSCQSPSVTQDMVHFDQAFIPVLYYTYQGDMNRAKTAVIQLDFQWQKFQDQYQKALPEDEDWQEAFRLVHDWLGDAYVTIDFNDAQLALIQLEHVRFELRQLRKRADIDYYLDDVYDFQTALEVVHETASDPQLCLLEWPAFDALAEEVRQRWEVVRRTQPDETLFELDPYDSARLESAKALIQEDMNDFQKALDCAQVERIASAVDRIVPRTYDLMAVFGRFGNAQTYYAQQ